MGKNFHPIGLFLTGRAMNVGEDSYKWLGNLFEEHHGDLNDAQLFWLWQRLLLEVERAKAGSAMFHIWADEQQQVYAAASLQHVNRRQEAVAYLEAQQHASQ